jgi:hypothetical protein
MQPEGRTWIVHESESHGVAEQLVRYALRNQRINRNRFRYDVGQYYYGEY